MLELFFVFRLSSAVVDSPEEPEPEEPSESCEQNKEPEHNQEIFTQHLGSDLKPLQETIPEDHTSTLCPPAQDILTDSAEPAETRLETKTDEAEVNDEELDENTEEEEDEEEEEEEEAEEETEQKQEVKDGAGTYTTPGPVKQPIICEQQEGMSTLQVQYMYDTCWTEYQSFC